MAFFTWFAGVLSDPNDKQGSTKRLCLFLFLGTIMALLIWATITSRTGLPTIPESILNLVYFVVGSLLGGIGLDKGVAAWKTVNAAASTESTTSTTQES